MYKLGKRKVTASPRQEVYEIQHLPIYIHLQATACKRGWLKYMYESGLSNELFSKKI